MIFNFEPKNTAVTLCEEKMKNIALATSCALFLSFSLATLAASTSVIPEIPQGASNFYKSDKVTVKNVSFENLYKMKVAGHLYLPKNEKNFTSYYRGPSHGSGEGTKCGSIRHSNG